MQGARFTHADGRVCHHLAYALETMPVRQQLYGWFYGQAPDLLKCQREHLYGPDGQPLP
jgi:hypothetical protein